MNIPKTIFQLSLSEINDGPANEKKAIAMDRPIVKIKNALIQNLHFFEQSI